MDNAALRKINGDSLISRDEILYTNGEMPFLTTYPDFLGRTGAFVVNIYFLIKQSLHYALVLTNVYYFDESFRIFRQLFLFK